MTQPWTQNKSTAPLRCCGRTKNKSFKCQRAKTVLLGESAKIPPQQGDALINSGRKSVAAVITPKGKVSITALCYVHTSFIQNQILLKQPKECLKNVKVL